LSADTQLFMIVLLLFKRYFLYCISVVASIVVLNLQCMLYISCFIFLYREQTDGFGWRGWQSCRL